ncbi:MAG: TraR/DksA family transcriptional regulator [Bacteroidetes bacterium]|nr:TraR/DksA family transcriptional regulator [Bacteroidota bacterium]
MKVEAPKIQTVDTNIKSGKTRYSDLELQEFKELITHKLADAKIEAKALHDLLKKTHDNGTDDTARAFKNLEECSDTQSKEELGQLASRQQKFIEQLEHALIRIETKCYGVCHISGKLIPKERLRIVPHTTQTIETKLISER